MILAIDTTKEKKSVALFWPKKLKSKLEWRENSTDVLEKIDQLLKENKLKISDIKYIVVDRGPGSFTGVRQGITVANTFMYYKKIPAIGIVNKKELDIFELAEEAYKNLNQASTEKIIPPFYGKKPNISKSKHFSKKNFFAKIKKR